MPPRGFSSAPARCPSPASRRRRGTGRGCRPTRGRTARSAAAARTRSRRRCADVDAAVVGHDHPLRVRRIDPEVVVVAVVEALHVFDGLAAVDRLAASAPAGTRLRRGWSGGPSASCSTRRAGGSRGWRSPASSSRRRRRIGRARPFPLRSARRRAGRPRGDRDADLAPDAFGQAAAGELLPGVAAVARHVESAAGAAAVMSQGERRACQKPAKRIAGFDGSIATSDAPVSASFFSTCCHVLPPSLVR